MISCSDGVPGTQANKILDWGTTQNKVGNLCPKQHLP